MNRITRVAPVYDRVIRFMQTVPKEQRIPETWYRPELEPFDVNYNKKHSLKVEAYGSATLHTAAEPWVCNVGPGDAVITAETLYFPDLVEQLILAAKSGAQVFCINHFYPNQTGTYTIKFDDHVEATAIVERKSPVSTVQYLVSGNTKCYNTYLPPYCQKGETTIPGTGTHYRWIDGYELGNGVHISLVQILAGDRRPAVPVYDKPSLTLFEQQHLHQITLQPLSQAQDEAL